MKRATIDVEVESHDLVEVRSLKGGMARIDFFSREALSDDPGVRNRGNKIATGIYMPMETCQQLGMQIGMVAWDGSEDER